MRTKIATMCERVEGFVRHIAHSVCSDLAQLSSAQAESHAGNDINTGIHPVLGKVTLISAFGSEGALLIASN